MDLFGSRSLPFMVRRNYWYEMEHILAWSVLAGLVEGQFGSVVVAKTFEGSALLISIATATPIAALVFSILWGMLCVGRPKIRFTTLLCLGIVLCTGAVAVIPATPLGGIWFIAQMAAAQVLLSGVITLRSAIWRANYPHVERGRITARLQAVREVIMVAASMLAAYTCDIEGLQQVAYRMIYPAAALFGLVGIVALQRLTVRGERAELKRLQEGDGVVPLRARSLIRMFAVSARILRTDTRFSHYILAQLCVGVANQLTLAVVVMLISQDLDIGFAAGYWVSTALIVGLPKLLLLGSISRWGRLFDRLGVVRFRVVNVMCWISSLSFGLLATLVIVYRDILGPGFVIWAVLLFAIRGLLYGLGMGGGRLAWNIGHLHFSRSEEAEIYMGIHVSLTGIRGLFAPMAGMAIWKLIGWPMWVIALLLAMLSLWMFQRLAERERREGHESSAA